MTTTAVPSTDRLPSMLEGIDAVHTAMRRDAARLPRAIAGADRRNASALAGWYRRFHHVIETHHTREDDLVWPALAARSGSFDDQRAALAHDHEVLDVALADAARAIAALAADLTEEHRAEAVRAAQVLAEVLVAHLDREEQAAFDEIVRCFPEDDWNALEEQMMRDTPMRAIAFEAPWALQALPEDVRAERIADAPVPLRLLYRFSFLPRYQRLVLRAGM